MDKNLISKSTLLGLVVVISALFLTMIHQFLMAIFMAGLFSAMVTPIHHRLTVKLKGRENLASVITVLGIVLLILVPLAFLITLVVAQAISVGQSITPWVQAFIKEPSAFSEYLVRIPYYEQLLPYRDTIIEKAGELVGTVTSFLIESLSSFTKLTIEAVFSSIIMLYVMFYFLSMGDVLLKKILYFLPLDDSSEKKLLYRFTSVARATLKGTLIIGIIQGAICGFAFALAGIKGPVFWGTVMAVMSIIPAVGTPIIWIPALIVLALTGNFGGVAILAILCGLVAGNLDNLLRPRLVGKDTQMHDLFVLFGTLGGISMFGLVGIMIGPIVAALFITVWEIYGDTFKNYLPDVDIVLKKEKFMAPEDDADHTESK